MFSTIVIVLEVQTIPAVLTLRYLPQNPDKEVNRQELLTQPMRVQITGLPSINTANKEYSDWLGSNQSMISFIKFLGVLLINN